MSGYGSVKSGAFEKITRRTTQQGAEDPLRKHTKKELSVVRSTARKSKFTTRFSE